MSSKYKAMVLSCIDPRCQPKINNIMKKVSKISDLLSVRFLGAGNYKIEVKSRDYAAAEDIMDKFQKLIEKEVTGETSYKFERD